MIYTAMTRGVTPYDDIKAVSNGRVNYAKGCERWSNNDSGFQDAIAAAKDANIAVALVGTWSLDWDELWAGVNATTGEHIDITNLNLVGAIPHH